MKSLDFGKQRIKPRIIKMILMQSILGKKWPVWGVHDPDLMPCLRPFFNHGEEKSQTRDLYI